MRFDELMTDRAVLVELGARLERHRLERNLTQDQLAELAGVGRATLQRLERGDSVQMTSMVKLLRALDLLGGLDAAIPARVELPIAQLERAQRQRLRQRGSGQRSGANTSSDADERWSWGDGGPGA
jgi:putative transcriptional regulator